MVQDGDLGKERRRTHFFVKVDKRMEYRLHHRDAEEDESSD